MYLLYEHLKSPAGDLLATDMLLTSIYPGRPGVDFKNLNDSVIFLSTKDKVFKAVPSASRSYDPDTKIWTFLAGVGAQVYKAIKDSKLLELGLKIQSIENLADQVKSGRVSKPVVTIPIDPADFFYTPEAPKSLGPSKEDAAAALVKIFQLPAGEEITRKHYLRAAMRLHPDRNGGDSNGMTELNFLWQVYNAQS